MISCEHIIILYFLIKLVFKCKDHLRKYYLPCLSVSDLTFVRLRMFRKYLYDVMYFHSIGKQGPFPTLNSTANSGAKTAIFDVNITSVINFN